MSKTSIAIIGSGLTGLTLADKLRHKADIVIFEKSRSVGGRLSTRYAGDYEFDHGAQTIKATHPDFTTFLTSLLKQGIVAEWDSGYVGVPKMNSIGKHLAKDLNVHINTHICKVEREGERWRLTTKDGGDAGAYDAVVCTAPPEQNCLIMPEEFPFKSDIKKRKLRGCFALMLGFIHAPDINITPFEDYIIASIIKNHEKPQRETAYSLLLLSQYDWAEAHMEYDSEKVTKLMLRAASTLCHSDLNLAEHKAMHRWRFASVGEEGTQAGFIAPELKLAACGDWCLNGDAQSAFLSALHTAQAIEAAL